MLVGHHDLSQERVAEMCGVHRNYLGAVERAERTPSIVAAGRIPGALGTTLAEILSDVEQSRNGGNGG